MFDSNPAVTSFFQGGVKRWDGIDSGIDSVFDFPAYFDIRDVMAKSGKMDVLSKTLAEDRLYPNPEVLVTFLGNHDVRRFMSEPGATSQRLKLAFTLLLTYRGTPCIYYGDEIGMLGGNDPENRHDFPGGWPGIREARLRAPVAHRRRTQSGITYRGSPRCARSTLRSVTAS